MSTPTFILDASANSMSPVLANSNTKSRGILYDNTNNIIYVLSSQSVPASVSYLTKINLSNRTATDNSLGNGSVRSMIFGGSNDIYFTDNTNKKIRRIYQLDSTPIISDLAQTNITGLNNLVYNTNSGWFNVLGGISSDTYACTRIIKVVNGATVDLSFCQPSSANIAGLAVDNSGYLYTIDRTNNTIIKINQDGTINNSSWSTHPYYSTIIPTDGTGINPVDMFIDTSNTYMYISDQTHNDVLQVDMTNGTVLNVAWTGGYFITNSLNGPERITTDNISTNMYIFNNSSRKLYAAALPQPTNFVCFKEDSQILTDTGYRPIQDLRKGELVKTHIHGYKAIDMIAKKTVMHICSEERIKDQLYKCSPEQYPELTDDLIITGCHCILVDNFASKEQCEKVIEINGDTYVTDDKYRLPACADERSTVYEKAGVHTIYHFALENENYYENYGVYANGLLVETTSCRYLKELSDMTLIE
jgi:hypothetical protein